MNTEKIFADALAKYRSGDCVGAASLYRELLLERPGDAGVHYNLAIACRGLGQADEAVAAFSRALELKADFPEAENNLGSVLRSLGRLDEAEDAFRRAVRLRPDFAEAWNNLGVTLRNLGRVGDALPCLERSMQLAPQNAALHSNCLHALHFLPGCDPERLRRAHADWNKRHAAPPRGASPVHPNSRDPSRRLRIGYLSACFREHCQSFFTVPLLSHHDHGQCEVFCYSDSDRPDLLTARLQGYADTWRDVAGMSDERLAQRVAGDRIDILVDLMVHTSGNRLLTLARRPAPVQVTWLGYPGGTGMDAVGYRLTDPWLDPMEGDGSPYPERPLRLADTFWCYDPLATEPAVGGAPWARNGHITFGCLNNFSKVNDPLLEAWARILGEVPGSRLLLMAPQGRARARVRRILKVGDERLEFTDFQQRGRYLETYGRIDLCLDTFPYNGHTTSLDAYWMGVPVVSMRGTTPVSRAGLSQASNLGLSGWVAEDVDDYIRMAVRRAGDPAALASLRATLRARMTQSPLMDGGRFARTVEAAYRIMWCDWCAVVT